MAITNSLPQYVSTAQNELIRKSALAGKSANDFNLQTGVKTESEIMLLETSVSFGDGSNCGWNEAGTSKVTGRKIKANPIKVNMSFCDKKLMNSAIQHEVRVAAGQKTLPFEQDFVDGVIASISENIEMITWQGDTVSGSTDNLKKADGLLKLLKNDSGSIKLTSTDAEYVANMDAVFKAIPDALIDKAVIYVNPGDFRGYLMAMQAKNLFHFDGSGLSGKEVFYPGSTVKIKVAPGMPKNNMVALNPENVYRGTDLMGDDEKFDFWYSQDNREFRLAVEFTLGFQIAFPDQCVIAQTT